MGPGGRAGQGAREGVYGFLIAVEFRQRFMKIPSVFPERWFSALRSWLGVELKSAGKKDGQRGNGQSLLRLHEYQHRVIVEIFRVSIAGFFGFTLLLMGISIYTFFDPYAPGWMSLLVGVLCLALLGALYRTVQEFKSYRNNYDELTDRLRSRLRQQNRAYAQQGEAGKTSVEHRLISALKPKEHAGWDHKSCDNCKKAIELLSTVCQHCGQEQEDVLVN